MSKREGDPPMSQAHVAYKRKQGKKECPSCKQIFGSKHFEYHKTKYFWHGAWKCCEKGNKQNVEAVEAENISPQTSTEGIERRPVVSIVRQKLQKKLSSNLEGEIFNDSDDEEEEFWENVTLQDIDADFKVGDGTPDVRMDLHSHGNTARFLFISLCIFICSWQACHLIPDTAIQALLSFLSDFFNALSAENVALLTFAYAFPSSIYKLHKEVGFQKDNFTKFVVCKKCFKLYDFEDCILVVEGQQQSKKCSNILFPNHTQLGRRTACGEVLLKSVQLLGRKKLYPYKTFCYKSIASSLAGFVKKPHFERKCEDWRTRKQVPGFLADVFDGRIWAEFQSPAKNNFLKDERNYGIMLNLDWFQPYDHVRYSVGVMYAVFLNLPRAERFKIKNVLIVGIIPDMKKEPSVHSFIGPLVDELKCSWDEGFSLKSYKDKGKENTFKLALMCVGCDIPATRKLCGFLGHGATFGCSKCYKSFPGDFGNKNYGGFDVNNWPPRDITMQRGYMDAIKRARTQTEKDHLESLYGLRYSPLWELDYFDPIRMSIVDPMHNLYQGTAKRMVKIWIEQKILLPEQLEEVQSRVDSVSAASNIGAIPRKIASSFGGFTADQWKNWTNVFSIFALIDILPADDIEVWREFVLASNIITSKYITEPDIRKFETHILEFCKAFERKYGSDKVTPNMHLHCHLANCVRDFGPVYSFWLFSFERYNGHLGSFPNNGRAIELQLMRRFTRDAYVNSVEIPEQCQEIFSKHFSDMKGTDNLEKTVDDHEIHQILYLSKRNAPIPNQKWSNISAYGYSKLHRHCLSSDEQRVLQQTYQAMYPDLIDLVFPESCRKCSFVSLGKEVYGSWNSRHKRSSFVMAYWNAEDGQILKDDGTGDIFPGVVQTYYLHNLLVDNESRVHLFAKVYWLSPLHERYRHHCGKPVEVWARDMFEVFGPSAFIPIQRIKCKFVRADGSLGSKLVSYICPLNNGMNI